MNNQAVYEQLIERARHRVKPEGYYEVHHIVPRSMGGSEELCNRVNLTYFEHRLAHMLLYRIFRDTNPKLVFAIELFYNDTNPQRKALRTSVRLPKWVRRERQLVASRIFRELGYQRCEMLNRATAKRKTYEINKVVTGSQHI